MLYSSFPNKILFITLSNIGDVILTLPVLSALKDSFPGADIDVVVGPIPKDIFIKDPGIKEVIVYNKHASLREKIRFIKKLRNKRYDLAMDMRNSLIPLLIWLIGRISLLPINHIKHKKMVHLNKLKRIGIEYKPMKNIYIDDKDRKKIELMLKEKGVDDKNILVGISPSSRSHLKQWDAMGFISAAKELIRNDNYKVILVGSSTETERADKIKKSIGSNNLIDLTAVLTINELFALIERLNVLLTCDSACMHIACDLGIKTAAIFGPTDPNEYGPTGKNDIVIRKALSCSPCKKAQCRFNHECMRSIKYDEVVRAVNSLLC